MRKIIDTHTFLGSNTALGVNYEIENFREQKSILQEEKIDLKFLFMACSKNDNLTIAETVKKNSDILLGGLILLNPNPNYQNYIEYSSATEVESVIKKGYVSGLKLHSSLTKTRVDDILIDDFSRLATDYDLPLVVHCGKEGHDFTSADYFRSLKDKFPSLKIVCAHYGGLEESFMRSYFELIKEREGIFLNTTGLSGEVKSIDLATGKNFL